MAIFQNPRSCRVSMKGFVQAVMKRRTPKEDFLDAVKSDSWTKVREIWVR